MQHAKLTYIGDRLTNKNIDNIANNATELPKPQNISQTAIQFRLYDHRTYKLPRFHAVVIPRCMLRLKRL